MYAKLYDLYGCCVVDVWCPGYEEEWDTIHREGMRGSAIVGKN